MKRCTVACDTTSGILSCELHLADGASIDDALQVARREIGEIGEHSVDWDSAAIGIFGKIHARAHIWQDGERIEVYRPLQHDPRARRRQRAAPKRGNR